MTIPLDPRFIPAFSIEDVLLDKDTGAPLSGGLVYFEEDDQRGMLKPIYQISGTSPNYTFIQLPNPMTLSAIGTFVDALDNPVIPYFYPFDAAGNVELYYIRVTSSGDVPQFDREAQPYVAVQESNEVLNVITNELSNPQFAEVNFDTSAGAYTYSVNAVTDSVINIAPDWDLVVSAQGAGTVTLTQVTPTGSLNIASNPATLLTIASGGLTKLQLRQRIYGSPNLWGSGFIAATFVAKTYSGTAVTLNMFYSQSGGTVIDQQFLPAASLPSSGAYQTFNSTVQIPASNSSNTFPTAYIDIYFDIPLSIQIDITSVMVAFTGNTSINNMSYDQESYARQVDHLYHDAYPVVPVGGLIQFWGFGAPAHYIDCTGAEISRITYQKLFRAVTTVESVTLTTGVATFTVANGIIYAQGHPLEGAGIPAGTTISSISGNTITMSALATQTGVRAVRFFSVGKGDGSTTFNVPYLVDCVLAQSWGSLLQSGGVGTAGGSKTAALTGANMAAHKHGGLFQASGASTSGPGAFVAFNPVAATTDNGTTVGGTPLTDPGTPFSIVQPTRLVRYMIRFE
ncbi:MAG TPA: hypothetical protein VGF75_01085 [Candidatus Saccharimonadales bacterium]